MHPAVTELEQKHRKPAIAQVQSGDTVRVHQLIREGSKQRIQVFEGVVIRTHRMGGVTATITVRRIASGVGVEKTYLLHSPNVSKIEIMRRAKVRRNFLSYLRARRGKSARLQELAFDKAAVNAVAAADELDAEITEISPGTGEDELDQAEVTTDAVSADEDTAVAADDTVSTDDGGEAAPDEAAVEAEEIAEGVEKADDGDKH